jgi:hypothetical protein
LLQSDNFIQGLIERCLIRIGFRRRTSLRAARNRDLSLQLLLKTLIEPDLGALHQSALQFVKLVHDFTPLFDRHQLPENQALPNRLQLFLTDRLTTG